MSEHRIRQIEGIFQNEIASFLTQRLSEKLGLLTVSRVKIARDLKTAKVWLRTYPKELSETSIKEEIFPLVKDLISHLKRKVKLKYMPQMSFLKDVDFQESLKVEKLIDETKNNST